MRCTVGVWDRFLTGMGNRGCRKDVCFGQRHGERTETWREWEGRLWDRRRLVRGSWVTKRKGIVVDWGQGEGNVLWRTRGENDACRGSGRTGTGCCEGRVTRVGTRKVGKRGGCMGCRVLVIGDGAQKLGVLLL